jgi:zinc protease
MRSPNRTGLLALAIAGAAMMHASAAVATKAAPISLPSMNARVETLSNGLTLIVQEDHAAPVASVQAWCRTGSINEGDQLGAGLSHILEHMLFKGTEKRTALDITHAIQDGGGYINAYTSFDRTVFWIDIPSKGTASALDVLADVVTNATLPADEYAKEQEVIRREFAMGEDDPDRVSSIELFKACYRVHPYQHPVIGHLDLYNKLTRDDVFRYYKARYVPNNLFFVAVGDIDAGAVIEQLETFFKEKPMGALPSLPISQEPKQVARREHEKAFDTELTRLAMAWHVPDLTHPDVPALDLLSIALGSGRSSRLNVTIREDLGLAHSVSAFCYTPGDPGIFGVDAVLDPDKRDATEKEVLAIIGQIKGSGISPEELEKARKQTLSSHLAHLTTARGRASELGSSWLLTGSLDFSTNYLRALQEVTVDDIKRVAKTYLTEDGLTISVVHPPGAEKEKATGSDTADKPGSIQKFVLGNGLRLLVKEDKRLPLVSMTASFKGGVLAETQENNGVSRLMANLLLKGTEKRSAAQLADDVEGIGGQIGSDAGNNSIGVSLSVMSSDTEKALGIFSDVIMHPAFQEKEIAREKEAQLAALKEEDDDMMAIGFRVLRASLFDGHPYGMRPTGTTRSIAAIGRGDIESYFKRQFVGKNGVIAIFGDVDAEAVRKQAEKAFSGMPPGEESLKNIPAPAPLSQKSVEEIRKDRKQAVLLVGYRAADIFDGDSVPLELIDEASSDLGSRFGIRIREQMGLAYYVGSTYVPGLIDGLFTFYLGTSPERLGEVQKALEEEIGKMVEEGLSEAEFRRAKEKYLGQQEIRNQSNAALAKVVSLDELYGLGFDHFERTRERIATMTPDDAKKAIARFFANKPSVEAVVKP